MQKAIFIQANNKQKFGARLAQYALKKNSKEPDSFQVRVLNVDELPEFRSFQGKTYLRDGKETVYRSDDLQSFTLSRFMPPEQMGFQGRAIVIDPDIFALTDINDLLNMDMQGKAVAACKKKGAWDTSVMLLDCNKLSHWKIAELLARLEQKQLDYSTLMTLSAETSILELPRIWNSLDLLTPEMKILHTTGRLTQPWKTGLPVDFTRKRLPKIFGIVPREPVLFVLGRYPMTYQPHPDKNIERFFFQLTRAALSDGAVTPAMIEDEIRIKNIRPDFVQVMHSYA